MFQANHELKTSICLKQSDAYDARDIDVRCSTLLLQVGFDTEGTAIFDTMSYVGNEVCPQCKCSISMCMSCACSPYCDPP